MFFHDCKTIDELTAAYRRAAIKNHPDMGGSEEIMKKINAEYAALLEKMRLNEANEAGMSAMPDMGLSEEIVEMIQKIILIDDIEIEVCGSWVWVGGNTFEHRVELKDAGYSYSGKQKRWYWGRKKKNYRMNAMKMNDIRKKYGSTDVKASTTKMIEA